MHRGASRADTRRPQQSVSRLDVKATTDWGAVAGHTRKQFVSTSEARAKALVAYDYRPDRGS